MTVKHYVELMVTVCRHPFGHTLSVPSTRPIGHKFSKVFCGCRHRRKWNEYVLGRTRGIATANWTRRQHATATTKNDWMSWSISIIRFNCLRKFNILVPNHDCNISLFPCPFFIRPDLDFSLFIIIVRTLVADSGRTVQLNEIASVWLTDWPFIVSFCSVAIFLAKRPLFGGCCGCDASSTRKTTVSMRFGFGRKRN